MGTHALPDEPGAGGETELLAAALKLPSVFMQGVTHIALRMASWSQHEQLELLLEKVLPRLAA